MKKYLLGFVITLIAGFTWGQQDPQASMYFFNPSFFNPGYVGSRGSVNLTAVHRSQWVGIDGAPMTQFLSFHMPFASQNMGLGVNVFHDRVGSRVNTGVYANYAYHIRLNRKNHRLAIGIRGGADIYQYDFSNLTVINPTDPFYSTNFSEAKFNVGLGLYYYGDRHYIGISAPRLLEPKVTSLQNMEALLKRHYFFTAGYAFRLSSVVDLKPSVLVKMVENAPLTFDANLSLYLYKYVWIGALYRFHESLGLNLAYTHKDLFTIGYAFDYPLFNEMRLNNFGSHEVVLSFDFRSAKRKSVSPRYF